MYNKNKTKCFLKNGGCKNVLSIGLAKLEPRTHKQKNDIALKI